MLTIHTNTKYEMTISVHSTIVFIFGFLYCFLTPRERGGATLKMLIEFEFLFNGSFVFNLNSKKSYTKFLRLWFPNKKIKITKYNNLWNVAINGRYIIWDYFVYCESIVTSNGTFSFFLKNPLLLQTILFANYVYGNKDIVKRIYSIKWNLQ